MREWKESILRNIYKIFIVCNTNKSNINKFQTLQKKILLTITNALIFPICTLHTTLKIKTVHALAI